jgi:hypothetical protein
LSYETDLEEAAREELERACTIGWRQLSAHTPWGDTFDGFTPQGREVAFERSYMWDGEPGGDIRVEVNVYEPHAHESGFSLSRTIARDPAA